MHERLSKVMDILILVGHPFKRSFVASLATSYFEGVRTTGTSVEIIFIGDLNFDLSLHEGYHSIQVLEPGLERARDAIKQANHIVFFYPQWWGSAPALLKGFIDRVFLPGFAFKYHQKGPYWDRLLSGKSGEIWLTSDSPRIWFWFMYRDSAIRWLKSATLEFSGIKPVKVTTISSVKNLSTKKRSEWIDRALIKGQAAGDKIARMKP